jgi:hypothetical protein
MFISRHLFLLLAIGIILVFGLLYAGFCMYEPLWFRYQEMYLASSDPDEIDAAAKAVAEKGKPAVPYVEKWFRSGDDALFLGACLVMEKMNGPYWKERLKASEVRKYFEKKLLSYDWSANAPEKRSIKNDPPEIYEYLQLMAAYTDKLGNAERRPLSEYYRPQDILDLAGPPEFLDINRDGTLEISLGVLYTNSMIFIYPCDKKIRIKYFGVGCVCDMDNDGDLEIFYGTTIEDEEGYFGGCDVSTFDGRGFKMDVAGHKGVYRELLKDQEEWREIYRKWMVQSEDEAEREKFASSFRQTEKWIKRLKTQLEEAERK